jgi:hypothetical protein
VQQGQSLQGLITLPSSHGGQARGQDGVEPVGQHLSHGGALQRAVGEELRHGGGYGPRGQPPIEPERGAHPITKLDAGDVAVERE